MTCGKTLAVEKLLSAIIPNQMAADWLVMLYHSIQVFDDFMDGDAVAKPDLEKLIWNTLVAIPANPFFLANAGVLLPVAAAQIFKWHAANDVESNGAHDAKSFVWRAGFYDVILTVCSIVNGPDFTRQNASKILGMYGENFEDYLKEFGHA